MKKFVLLLVMAIALLLSTNVMAEMPTGQCDFLKAEGKGLYGLCMAYCEAHEGPADIVDLTEEEAKALDPASLTLFNLFEKKAGEDGPELPCVNYGGSCPVWTQEELDRIGTLGGNRLMDREQINSSGYENYYDREYFWDSSVVWQHYALLRKYPYPNTTLFVGRYGSHNTVYPDANTGVIELTEEEYNSCKQMLIDHVTNPDGPNQY